MAEQLVSEVGESGLLALVREKIGPARPGEVWAGDDAAVVRSPKDKILFTTDLMVEGVDFDLSYASGADIGHKTVSINVSDLAAMGGFPLHALLTISLRPDVPVSLFESILEGAIDAAAGYRVSLVGGDISSATEIMTSAAIVGISDGDPILRSGARPGDAICVTGTLGGSAGGLFALQEGLRGANNSIDAMIRRHLRPHARVREAVRLATLRPTAMIDISDGLGIDLQRLMEASGTGCIVEPATIPLDPGLSEMDLLVGQSPEPLELGLGGGEDFELLFTIDRERYQEAKMLLGELGTQVTAIGEVTDSGMRLGDKKLEGMQLGWDHLRNR